jgi:hypothetical protein
MGDPSLRLALHPDGQTHVDLIPAEPRGYELSNGCAVEIDSSAPLPRTFIFRAFERPSEFFHVGIGLSRATSRGGVSTHRGEKAHG